MKLIPAVLALLSSSPSAFAETFNFKAALTVMCAPSTPGACRSVISSSKPVKVELNSRGAGSWTDSVKTDGLDFDALFFVSKSDRGFALTVKMMCFDVPHEKVSVHNLGTIVTPSEEALNRSYLYGQVFFGNENKYSPIVVLEPAI